jgi:CRISPR system Cascade subunit CasB
MESKTSEIYRYVQQKIHYICSIPGDGPRKAILAKLRHGIGKKPGEDPELWGILLEGLPEKWLSNRGEPSPAEWAIYTSLTLFALHQQGNDPQCRSMQGQGVSLGRAVRGLVKDDEDEERILRRFRQVVGADSMPELTHYLRSMVQLLRQEDIPLDYGALANDLYQFQFPEAAARVRLRWGEDYYRYAYGASKNADE